MLAADLLRACERAYDDPTVEVSGGRDALRYEITSRNQVLAFRGTLTEGLIAVSDWYNDFHAELTTSEHFPGRVHEGFMSSALALLVKLPPLHPHLPLLLTGHSKGGALAFLFAWVFRSRSPVTITFGAPKVGDGVFAEALGYLPVFRFECKYDVVPGLPPIGYASCGCQVVSPSKFRGSTILQRNHALETGYKPWIR